MAGTVYDPNDPSTWGPVVGLDANKQPIYANQPGPTLPGLGGHTVQLAPKISFNPDGSAVNDALGPQLVQGPNGLVTSDGATFTPNGKTSSGALSGLAGAAGKAGSAVAGAASGSGSGSGSGSQTQLAKDATAQSIANSQGILTQAQTNANTALNTQGPAALNPDAYRDTTATTAYASDATGAMRDYTAAQAKAALNSPNSQAAQAVSQANLALPANVSSVNTNIQAPTIGPAAQTGLVTVGNTELNPSATALQGQEIQAASNIANGPSAAMSQFQAGQSQVVKDQLAATAAARGSDRAGARREAMINIGASGAQQNLSAAALAAQETQSKNVAASTALQGIGSQALTAATTQANITSQQQQLQAQLDAAVSQGNTAAINSIQTQQAQLGLQAQTASATAGLGQQATYAGLATTNMAAANQNTQYNATAANQAAANYAAAQNAAMAQNSQTQTGVNQANAGATNAALAAYTGAQNTAGQNFATANTNTSQANAALRTQQATGNETRALAADQTSSANQLATTGLQQQGANSALGTANAANTTQATNAQTIVDANKAQAAATAQQNAALYTAVGTGLAAAVSDERAKVDIATVGGGSPSYADKYGQMLSDAYGNTATANPYGGTLSDERTKREVDRMGMDGVANFTRKAPAVTFRYKPGIEDGGAAYKAGTLAQGVEAAGPLGRMFVDERPDGLKEVQYGPMAHFEDKGAQHTADRALAVASAAYRRAR